MSDHKNTLAALTAGKTTDITTKELQLVETFKIDGLPGITSISDVGVIKALDMYMDGKTYHEIAKILNTKKEIVLYFAQKHNWYQTKMDHIEILDANLKERILQANLVNQDFLLQIQSFFKKKIGHKINNFFRTGDEDIANSVDRKDIEMFYKAVDLTDKLTAAKPVHNGRSPTVGLNLGDGGVSVERIGDNEVLITPRNKTTGEMLNELANLKRKEEETGNQKNTYDIIVEESKTKTNEKEEEE
jgi:hypothetical protein